MRLKVTNTASGSISLSLVFFTLCNPSLCSSRPGLGPVGSQVLSEFDKIGVSGFKAYLNAIRPPAPAPEIRSRLLAELSKEGEVQPAAKDRQKLSAVQPILQYHGWSGAVDVRVIRVFQAWIGMFAPSIVLISEHALHLLDADELQALVAHELGHAFFWDEYEKAREQQQYQRVQEIELRCDAVAILTLADLGLDPRKLQSGLDKITRFNARFGTPDNAGLYTPEVERARFLDKMIAVAGVKLHTR
jgi:Zn-dependent protease with chaperone function